MDNEVNNISLKDLQKGAKESNKQEDLPNVKVTRHFIERISRIKNDKDYVGVNHQEFDGEVFWKEKDEEYNR